MTDDRSRTCPICFDADVDDMRHVAVECFYDVNEVAPDAKREPIFREVPADGTYLALTRRYPAGTRDKRRLEERPRLTIVHTDQEPIGPIRLAEEQVYTLDCCKSCRSAFLNLFGAWSRGEYVRRHEPDELHNIPVRQNGAIVYLSEEQYRQWEIDRSAARRGR